MSLPVPQLDDRQYQDLLAQALGRIPQLSREWTDHNVHDPGVTFLELFAWLAELQIYYLDRIPAAHQVKFLRMLGFAPGPALPAQASLTFALKGPPGRLTVPPQTQVTAILRDTETKIIFETDRAVQVSAISLARIISSDQTGLRDYSDANAQEGNFFHAFGEAAEPGSALYLGLDCPLWSLPELIPGAPAEPLQLTVRLNLYDRDLPPFGSHGQPYRGSQNPDGAWPMGEGQEFVKFFPAATVAWQYWNGSDWLETSPDGTTLLAQDGTAALSWSGDLVFNVPPDLARQTIPPFKKNLCWLRGLVLEGGYEIPPRLESLQCHAVAATEAVTVAGENLGSSTGLPGQVFQCQQAPILAGSLEVVVEKPQGGWKLWQEVPDLDASGPDDEHYVVNLEEGTVQFGDGLNGGIPPRGANNVQARHYRCGGGTAGNLSAGTFSLHLEQPLEGLVMVTTGQSAGGAEAETLPDTWLRALLDLRTPYQAVTSADFEFLARQTPGLRVARAKALPLLEPPDFTPRQGLMTVVVAPFSFSPQPLPSQGFCRTVCEHLNLHRLITTEIRVIPPDYVRVSVDATVLLKPGVSPVAVRERIEAGLRNFLNPLSGGPSRAGWEFGRSVYNSEIFQAIATVPEVDGVLRVDLTAQGNFAYEGHNIALLKPHTLVYPGVIKLELLDADPRCQLKGARA
jgi:predicted phage baseplate assembly protein